MSIQSHVEELKRRHAALQEQIRFELARPAADPFLVAELKRKKLNIKDEIMRLGTPATIH